MTLYFLAIARIPLALAVSAYFVGPIIAVVLSVLFLREELTLRKLISLGLGFAGSLVILRPSGEIQAGIIMAFGAGLFFALYLIATRQASRHSDPVKTLAFQCVAGPVLLCPQAAFTFDMPRLDLLWMFVGLGLFSAVWHILTILAFRWADASTLAPLVYVELIGTSAIGYLVFTKFLRRRQSSARVSSSSPVWCCFCAARPSETVESLANTQRTSVGTRAGNTVSFF